MCEGTIAQIEQMIPHLRRFARALTNHSQKADDLVQDTLERALSRLHQFDVGTNLKAWLFTIMRNIHINHTRALRRAQGEPAELQDFMAQGPATQHDTLILKDLRMALRELSPEMREVVLLIGLEGVTYEEAAEILDVKVGTVKSRLSRAREILRQRLDGSLPAPVRKTEGFAPAKPARLRQEIARNYALAAAF